MDLWIYGFRIAELWIYTYVRTNMCNVFNITFQIMCYTMCFRVKGPSWGFFFYPASFPEVRSHPIHFVFPKKVFSSFKNEKQHRRSQIRVRTSACQHRLQLCGRKEKRERQISRCVCEKTRLLHCHSEKWALKQILKKCVVKFFWSKW